MNDPEKTQDGKKLLDAMLAKRGYLLPYHRLLGESDPALLAAYDAKVGTG